MKNIFSKKLYLQGLRKVRTIGIAMSIVMIALNALAPIISIIESQFSWRPSQTIHEVEAAGVAPCSILVLIFAPIMAYSMFSYLNERKSSDFYHALPQKRICVYTSFIAAIFTWITGALLASTLINALLWAIAVYYTTSISAVVLNMLTYLIAALVLSGFMTLAMTVTGTTISNMLVFLLFTLFIRAFGLFFLYGLCEVAPMFRMENSWLHIFDWEFFLPLRLIADFFNMDSRVFYDAEVLVYWAFVSVLLFAASAVLYHFRRSESAGKSAPNRLMQHIYRIAVTFPFMMLTMYMILLDGLSEYHLILIVFAMLVWVLYELMTTKKIKNVLKSLPLFLVPVLLSVFYVGGVYTAKTIVYQTTPSREEIVGAKMEGGNFYSYATWENAVLFSDFTSDSRVLDVISQAISDTKMTEDWDSTEKSMKGYQYRGAFTLKLKSGKKVTYNLVTKNDIRAALQNAEDLKDVLYSLPSEDMIRSINIHTLSDDYSQEIWDAFAEDFRAMDENERRDYLMWNAKNSSLMEIYVMGKYRDIDFTGEYSLDFQYTPKALRAFVQYSEKINSPIIGFERVKYCLNRIENPETHYASMHIFQTLNAYQDLYTSDIRVIQAFLNAISLDSHLTDFENAETVYRVQIELDPKYIAISPEYDVEENYGTTSVITSENIYSISEIYYVTFSKEDIETYYKILAKFPEE